MTATTGHGAYQRTFSMGHLRADGPKVAGDRRYLNDRGDETSGARR
jgi:hypothetical protein